MTKTQNILEHAEKVCKERGVRLTEKRKQVLGGLIQSETALSAYELADYCSKQTGQTIPAMSVYRILNFLQEEEFVHKLNVANKYVACAHIDCHHDHEIPQFLICNQCLRVKEIGIKKSTINALHRNVESAGFHLLTPQLEMDCVCEACRSSVA
ncbi:MAG: transcriptional repressor [Halioglobus sp.]|nr:transcriptional repressor [Halioglobus sp.]